MKTKEAAKGPRILNWSVKGELTDTGSSRLLTSRSRNAGTPSRDTTACTNKNIRSDRLQTSYLKGMIPVSTSMHTDRTKQKQTVQKSQFAKIIHKISPPKQTLEGSIKRLNNSPSKPSPTLQPSSPKLFTSPTKHSKQQLKPTIRITSIARLKTEETPKKPGLSNKPRLFPTLGSVNEVHTASMSKFHLVRQLFFKSATKSSVAVGKGGKAGVHELNSSNSGFNKRSDGLNCSNVLPDIAELFGGGEQGGPEHNKYYHIEKKLGVYDCVHFLKQKEAERILGLLQRVNEQLKILFQLFEENNKTKMVEIIEDLYNELSGQTTYPNFLIETFYFILKFLFEFRETYKCVALSKTLVLSLASQRMYSELPRFYELMIECQLIHLEFDKSLISSFYLLFAQLYLADLPGELRAYDKISRSYYGLGIDCKAKHFCNKVAAGLFESEGSLSRKYFPALLDYYIKEICERRLAQRMPVPSPRASFYEGIPLEGSDQLTKLETDKEANLVRFSSEVRRLAPKRPFCGFAGSVTYKNAYNLKRKELMTPLKLGDVNFVNLEEEYVVTPGCSDNVLKFKHIGFTNNTERALLSHQSANRSLNSFYLIPSKKTGRNNFQVSKQSIVGKQVVKLKDEETIFKLLSDFNNIGLLIEGLIEEGERYIRNKFAKEESSDFSQEDDH
jgi:hypothetical protein